MNVRKKAFIILIVPLAVACSHSQQEETKANAPIKVAVREIAPQTRPEILHYPGTIEADNTVALGFSVAGRVNNVNVQEGQQVSQGQLLAEVEPEDYTNAFQIATAAEEQVADNFTRLQELHNKGSLPERDFIAAKSAMEQAQANVRIAAKRLADTKLYAPYAGIMSAKQIEKGASAAPGMPAFTMLKTDKVYAKAPIAESDISKLTPGKEVKVIIPVLNDSLKGTIAIINPQADNTSRTYAVKIRLDNSSKKLLPGMLTEMLVYTGGQQPTILIPANAVVRDADDITYVFVASDNKSIRKRVTLHGVTTDNEVVVQSGLQTGDRLIIQGQTRLEDGNPVQF